MNFGRPREATGGKTGGKMNLREATRNRGLTNLNTNIVRTPTCSMFRGIYTHILIDFLAYLLNYLLTCFLTL